jgi:hypothetical protein
MLKAIALSKMDVVQRDVDLSNFAHFLLLRYLQMEVGRSEGSEHESDENNE